MYETLVLRCCPLKGARVKGAARSEDPETAPAQVHECKLVSCEQVYYQAKLQEEVNMPYPLPPGTVSMHVRCALVYQHRTSADPGLHTRAQRQALTLH